MNSDRYGSGSGPHNSGGYASGSHNTGSHNSSSYNTDPHLSAVSVLLAELKRLYPTNYPRKLMDSLDELNTLKAVWASHLKDAGVSPEQISGAAKAVMPITPDFFPSLPVIVKACNTSMDLFPPIEVAFNEAVLAASSGWESHLFSHEIVKHAKDGISTFDLQSANLRTAEFQQYKYNYEVLANRVRKGEGLADTIHVPIHGPGGGKTWREQLEARSKRRADALVRKMGCEGATIDDFKRAKAGLMAHIMAK